jgi:hypothetical protein
MRRNVEDAEESEPLLAKELYNTVRKAGERRIPDALKVSQQLVDLGVGEEAAKASRSAGEGLDQMREGVERAAKSVLGDETAALKRAQKELEELGDQLNREIAEATGTQPPQRNRDASRSSSRPARDDQGGPSSQQRQGQGAPPERRPEQDQQGSQEGDTRRPVPREKGQRRAQPEGRQGRSQSGEGQQQLDEQKGRGEQRQQDGQNGGQGELGRGEQQNQQGQQGGQGQQGRQGQGQRRLRGGDRGMQQGEERTREMQGGGPDGGAPWKSGDDRLGGSGGPGGPIRGDGFRQWTDRMREVEELLDSPEMRAEAARLRHRVRGEREEFKRHSKEPDWNKLRDLVAEPMNELRNRIAEEVRRRESPDALVPIDRDPVPPQFAEGVRRYYERLGTGK